MFTHPTAVKITKLVGRRPLLVNCFIFRWWNVMTCMVKWIPFVEVNVLYKSWFNPHWFIWGEISTAKTILLWFFLTCFSTVMYQLSDVCQSFHLWFMTNPMGFTKKNHWLRCGNYGSCSYGFPAGFPAGRNAFDVAYDSDSSGSHREVTGYNTLKPFMRTIHE